MFDHFLAAHCRRVEGAATPLKQVIDTFRAEMQPSKKKWPRTRIIASLVARGYPVAIDGTNVTQVVGLILARPAWTVEDGRVVRI